MPSKRTKHLGIMIQIMIQRRKIYSLKLQNIVERKVDKIQIVRNERKPSIYGPRLEGLIVQR